VKLDSFLAVKSPPASGERQQSSVGESPQDRPVQPGSGPVGTVVNTPTGVPTPTEVTRDVTPSGIIVEYESQPKRLYRVGTDNGFGQEIHMAEVPSVTTVLDVLRKDGLAWWGQGKGIQGVLDLFKLGVLTTAVDWDGEFEHIIDKADDMVANETSIVQLLKEHKLTVNHRLDQASDRGVNVHDALESWARTGRLPNAREFPPEEKGYVEGLLKFIEDVDPTPIRCEVMVGSVEHKFAGRFDLVMGVYGTNEYTARCYPKRTDKRQRFNGNSPIILADLKTSKGVYMSHQLQLAAYELASVEGGYPATDAQAVIHVTADGKYELVFSTATAEQFLAVRSVYAALEGLK
jgi:hypothetical protein